jgi:hypothetical protein
VLKTWIAVAALSLLVGCGTTFDRPRADDSEVQLSFDYVAVGGDAMMDQTLGITNSSSGTAAVPTLSFVALDAEGQPLTEVTVGTAYGSDRGLVVAPANYEVLDVLTFEGRGADRVEDVAVTVDAVRTLDGSDTWYPDVEYLDADGRTVPSAIEASTARVTNPGSQDYVVRLVGIEWNAPPPGRPQQARRVVPLEKPVLLPAGDSVDIAVPAHEQGNFGSLKAYISVK